MAIIHNFKSYAPVIIVVTTMVVSTIEIASKTIVMGTSMPNAQSTAIIKYILLMMETGTIVETITKKGK